MVNLYKMNEVFETIQGEGSFTGTPSIFRDVQSGVPGVIQNTLGKSILKNCRQSSRLEEKQKKMIVGHR